LEILQNLRTVLSNIKIKMTQTNKKSTIRDVGLKRNPKINK